MKLTMITAAAMVLMVSPAFAATCPTLSNCGTITNTDTNKSDNTNINQNDAHSVSYSSSVAGAESGAAAYTGPVTNTNNNNSSAAGGSGGNASINNERSSATAYAPGFAPTEPCQKATSGGVQTMGFGFSIGSTYSDAACERRNNAILLQNVFGLHDAGVALMCQDADVKSAIHSSGGKCPGE